MKILVLNGPNINFLGIREKGIYGNQDYDTLVKMIEDRAEQLPSPHAGHQPSAECLRTVVRVLRTR